MVSCAVLCYVVRPLQAAVEVRKQVNQLDNLTTSKAVDALLNAETVALFGNRQLEVRRQGLLLSACCRTRFSLWPDRPYLYLAAACHNQARHQH